MSIISPLDRLADKFNIIQFNSRELLNKLSIWASTNNDYVEVVLKVQDAPYFEKYTIPSLTYIKSNSIKDWTNFKPTGVKYWGNSMLSDTYAASDNMSYVVNYSYIDTPPVNYVLYDNTYGVPLNIILSAGTEVGDQCTFLFKITKEVNSTKANLISLIDSSNNSNIVSLSRNHLLPLYTINTPADSIDRIVKVVVQYVNNPSVGLCWELLDLYEFPKYELVQLKSQSVYRAANFKDPFYQ